MEKKERERMNRKESVNIGHLEAVVHVLQQHFISGVSRVCKSIPLSPSVSRDHRRGSSLKDIHVDVVCILNGKPVWIIVLAAAQSYLALRSSSIILFFTNGLASHVYNQLRDEFGASEIMLEFSVFSSEMLEETEGDWINVIARSYKDACVLEINLADSKNVVPNLGCNVQVSTVDSSQLEVLVGKSETCLHPLEENASNGVSSQQELSVNKPETRMQQSQESLLMLFFPWMLMPKILVGIFCTDKLEDHHRVVPYTPYN